MERLYFTFGSDPQYPYPREDYVVAFGKDVVDCIRAFKDRYPNRPGSDSVNCAEYYTHKEWEQTAKKYYKDKEPEERIISDNLYGRKPKNFNPIWFFVPAKNTIIFLQEGSGDNLNAEDLKEGYVDYLDYTSFELGYGEVEDGDGGMLLTKEYVQDKYECLADTIPDILDDLFTNPYMDAQILDRET